MARMTPVQAAKVLDIRPQIVYGFIRQNRIPTFTNPEGKTALVELDDVKRAAGGVRHHREKDPETGKPKRRVDPKIRTGTILDMHAFLPLEGRIPTKSDPKPHKPKVVVGTTLTDEGNPSLIATATGEGTLPMYWEIEKLSERVAKGLCRIESPENMLSVIMFHWVHNEAPELAASLDEWIQANGLTVPTITELTDDEKR
jgi:hypothetical protein